jgi:hypothetical protein
VADGWSLNDIALPCQLSAMHEQDAKLTLRDLKGGSNLLANDPDHGMREPCISSTLDSSAQPQGEPIDGVAEGAVDQTGADDRQCRSVLGSSYRHRIVVQIPHGARLTSGR